MITDAPRITVVISTYNRATLLAGAVEGVLQQRGELANTLELIVVDNNSTDTTPRIVADIQARDPRVRYLFEPQQGSSYGRNAGIRAARAPIVAFTDDDVRTGPDWIEAIVRAFRENPQAAVVGGRVLPTWPSPPPEWLTREHWAPLALVDYGERPFVVSAERPVCLVTANAAFRREVFDAVGGFATEFQLDSRGMLGSVEDQELQLRVTRAGLPIVYDPRITVHADVQPSRLQRAYHRRWHTGHGYFYALLRFEQMDATRTGHLFGVPAHLYRQALEDVIGWTCAKAAGHREAAFRRELRLRFFHGYFRTRRRQPPIRSAADARIRLPRLRRSAAAMAAPHSADTR
jgi:GT2 family glycosyltransferase